MRGRGTDQHSGLSLCREQTTTNILSCCCIWLSPLPHLSSARQDKTNSLFPRVVNKHTSAFLHSALAQRGTNLLRIHVANIK